VLAPGLPPDPSTLSAAALDASFDVAFAAGFPPSPLLQVVVLLSRAAPRSCVWMAR